MCLRENGMNEWYDEYTIACTLRCLSSTRGAFSYLLAFAIATLIHLISHHLIVQSMLKFVEQGLQEHIRTHFQCSDQLSHGSDFRDALMHMPNAANVAIFAYTIERIYYYYYLLTTLSIQMSLNRCLRYFASMIIWVLVCSVGMSLVSIDCKMKIPPVNFSNYGSYWLHIVSVHV